MTPEHQKSRELTVRGCKVFPGLLEAKAQRDVLRDIDAIVSEAPFIQPITRWGKPMSVRMTAAGRFGWLIGPKGYHYSDRHPSGVRWPAIPETLMAIWNAVAETDRAPECALINLYASGARMGMHQDRDEADFDQPVVSVSLGDDALFRIGNHTRGGSTESLWLKSGDVLCLAGDSRLRFHGIDKTRFGSSGLITGGGRINVTMRVVR